MRKLALILAFIIVAPLAAHARGDEALALLDKFNQRLNRAHDTIEDVEQKLADQNLSDTALRTQRGRLETLPKEIEEIIEVLTPRLSATADRLKELQSTEEKPVEKEAEPEKPTESSAVPTPPQRPSEKSAPKPAPVKQGDKAAVKSNAPTPAPTPAPAAAPEQQMGPEANSAAASVKAELDEQRQLYEGTDATLKRARALLLETRQLIVSIVARQRGLFARTLFLRTDGLFSPALWRAASSDAPPVFTGSIAFLSDRAANFASRVNSGGPWRFIALVVAILLAIPPALILSRRVARRTDGKDAPSAFQKAGAAAWTAPVVAAAPVAAIGALGLLFEGFDLLDATLEPIWRRIVEAVARVAATYAIARGVFAPAHPKWRLLDPGDRLAHLLVRVATLAALTLSVTRLAEQLEETAQASVPVVIVTRGIGVVIIAALIAYSVARLPRPKNDAPADDAITTPAGRDWVAAARALGIAAVLALLGACAAGYVTFANFLVLQAGWLAAVVAIVYVVVMLLRGGLEAALDPGHFVGRQLVTGLGVRREQLAPLTVLLTGIVTLLGVILAFLMVIAPLGFESGDFLGNVSQAFFRFNIGGVTVSPSAVLTAIGIFAAVLTLTQGLRRWLDTRFLPLTRLDLGLRSSISATLGYAGFILAAGVALSHVGLGVEKLAIVAGALSVGIGFGLQSIVSNFVSGLILLWERAIRVGDWVVIGDEQGYVKRINVRSTEIETFDRATMIVPNSNLVAGVVKNWLRGDKIGRIKVALTPRPNVDPERIRDIMLAAARAQDGVLRIPAPQVMFLGMEASAFKFELWCYVEDVEKSSRVRSDLYFDLYRRLTEAGIAIADAATATPPTIVQLPNLDRIAAAAAASALAIEAGVLQSDSAEPAAAPEAEQPARSAAAEA